VDSSLIPGTVILIPGTAFVVSKYGVACSWVRHFCFRVRHGAFRDYVRTWKQIASESPPYLESKTINQSAPKDHDGKIIMMRTTINLPDDVAEIIRSFADVKGISLGQAVADLVLKGLQPRVPVGSSVFPQFEIAEGAAPISLEQTLAADDEV